MNPPELTLLNLIESKWTETNPSKAQIKFYDQPTNIDWDYLLASRAAGTRHLWVSQAEAPHRAVGFQAKRVDLNLIVNIFLRSVSRSKADLDEAMLEEKNMIEEVSRIIPAERHTVTEFVPSVKHFINKDDMMLDPPLLAHEVHVACLYVRYPS